MSRKSFNLPAAPPQSSQPTSSSLVGVVPSRSTTTTMTTSATTTSTTTTTIQTFGPTSGRYSMTGTVSSAIAKIKKLLTNDLNSYNLFTRNETFLMGLGMNKNLTLGAKIQEAMATLGGDINDVSFAVATIESVLNPATPPHKASVSFTLPKRLSDIPAYAIDKIMDVLRPQQNFSSAYQDAFVQHKDYLLNLALDPSMELDQKIRKAAADLGVDLTFIGIVVAAIVGALKTKPVQPVHLPEEENVPPYYLESEKSSHSGSFRPASSRTQSTRMMPPSFTGGSSEPAPMFGEPLPETGAPQSYARSSTGLPKPVRFSEMSARRSASTQGDFSVEELRTLADLLGIAVQPYMSRMELVSAIKSVLRS